MTSQVAFPIAIENIAAGTPERAAFESAFVTSMATELGGVSESSITVNGISAGSAVVDWTLTAPFSERAQAASLVTTLSDSVTAGSASLVVTVAGRPLAADTRSLTPPVVTRPVDVQCVGAWETCAAGCADKVYLITAAASVRSHHVCIAFSSSRLHLHVSITFAGEWHAVPVRPR